MADRLNEKRALLIIDVINDFNFPDSARLLRQSIPMATRLAKLQQRFRDHQQPVIYINDNFGEWQSDFTRLVESCLKTKGAPIVRWLMPQPGDYFVLKPKHSAFYSTSLEILLRELSVKKLIIAGIATNICVFFTANDAHMRGFEVIIPRDCVAANTKSESDYALKQMARILKATVCDSKVVRP